MADKFNSTLITVSRLDKAAFYVTQWTYSSCIHPDVVTFGLVVAVATLLVFIGSYATVNQPKLATDPIYDRHSPLWDPTDRDGCALYISLTDGALNLNMDKIDMKSALLLPVMAAGALYGLDYLLRLYNILKLRLLNYYIVAMVVPAGYMAMNYVFTAVLRNVGYLLGLKHNLGYFFSRFRLTLSSDEKLPLGVIEQMDLKKMKMTKEELKEYENWMLEHNNVKLLKFHKIEAKKQRIALVWDAKFVFVLPLAAVLLKTLYDHMPALHDQAGKINWIANDLASFTFAISGCMLTRVATISVASLMLALFFVYDIYFVFCSKLMVSVASGLELPVTVVIPRAPEKFVAWSAQGYQELLRNTVILGLGDIVLPAVFISLCLRFDYFQFYARTKLPFHHLRCIGTPEYFLAAMVGYIAALLMTVTANYYSNHGQPALLYIVPSLFVSVFGCAWFNGEFSELWQYNEEIVSYSKEANEDNEDNENDADESQSDPEETYIQLGERVFEFEVTEDETDDTYIIEDDTDEDEEAFDDEDLSNEIDYLLRDQQEEK